jgi:hypothetical protein
MSATQKQSFLTLCVLCFTAGPRERPWARSHLQSHWFLPRLRTSLSARKQKSNSSQVVPGLQTTSSGTFGGSPCCSGRPSRRRVPGHSSGPGQCLSRGNGRVAAGGKHAWRTRWASRLVGREDESESDDDVVWWCQRASLPAPCTGAIAEPLLNPTEQRLSIFPIRDHEAWAFCKEQESAFWVAEAIDLGRSQEEEEL